MHQLLIKTGIVMCIVSEKDKRGIVSRTRRTNKVGESKTGSIDRFNANAYLRDLEFAHSSYRTSSIFITTFNVNGRIPKPNRISRWLNCDSIFPPDFYIIGLQEIDLSPQAFIMHTSTRHAEWKAIIAKSFPENSNYDLIGEIRSVGILLLVYRRVGSKIKVRASEIDAVVVPTTQCNVFGTTIRDKGAVAISIYMNDTSVCFVNTHLSAHTEGNDKRIMDYKHIVKKLRFHRNNKRLFEHDAVFWFGDLNFRLDTSYGLSNDELRKLCSDDAAYRDMIVYDQLKRAMKLKIIFENFKEPEILNFRPTYKYDINSDNWDSSKKRRVPAWCDRILWWNRKDVHIRQKFYNSVPSVKISDHRPVRALFYLGVQNIDLREYSKAYRKFKKTSFS